MPSVNCTSMSVRFTPGDTETTNELLLVVLGVVKLMALFLCQCLVFREVVWSFLRSLYALCDLCSFHVNLVMLYMITCRVFHLVIFFPPSFDLILFFHPLR